jgi:hypothetical protein
MDSPLRSTGQNRKSARMVAQCNNISYLVVMRRALNSIRDRFDRAGIVLSGLCALHCILGIVLVSVLGLGGEALLSPAIHRVGLALALLVGTLTLGLGVLRHGQYGALAIGACGLALMAAALAAGHGF